MAPKRTLSSYFSYTVVERSSEIPSVEQMREEFLVVVFFALEFILFLAVGVLKC